MSLSQYREIQEGNRPYVEWWDNFNANYRRKFANIEKVCFTMCNWTGTAVRPYKGARPISMELHRDVNQNIVPIMPPDLFLSSSMKEVCKLIVNNTMTFNLQQRSSEYNKNPPPLYDTSLMVIWKADRVPLKPDTDNINLPQRYKDAIRANPNSLGNFYPTGIQPENIGSNLGLLKIVKQFSIDKGIQTETCTRYHVVTADMNIHRRIIQVTLTT